MPGSRGPTTLFSPERDQRSCATPGSAGGTRTHEARSTQAAAELAVGLIVVDRRRDRLAVWPSPSSCRGPTATRSRRCSRRLRTSGPRRRCGSRASNVGKVTEVEPARVRRRGTGRGTGEDDGAGGGGGGQHGATGRGGDDGDRGRGPADQDGRDLPAPPAAVPRGQPVRRRQAGQPGAPEADDGHIFPLEQTLGLGPARPGADHAPGGRPRRTCRSSSTSSATRSTSTAAPRASRSSTAPRRGAFKYTVAGERGAARHRAARPLGPDPQPRPGRRRALGRNEEQLKDLVTNFRIVAGSFAAEERRARAGDRELPGGARGVAARRSATSTPPSRRCAPSPARRCRACARPARPLDAATPFIHQVRRLVSKHELRGLSHDLRPTIPRPREARAADDPVPRPGPRRCRAASTRW